MLKNYLKITWAVMKRRKFYTFISLFGISMTLTILIVLAAFIDSSFAPEYPEALRNRTLYVSDVKLIDQQKQNSSMNPISQYFVKTYIKTMPLPEKVSMSSNPMPTNTYLNGQKARIWIKYTDSEFWDITQFAFLEGKGFTSETIKNSDNAVIINDLTRDEYFGKGVSVVGKSLEIDDVVYRIIGVVKGCPITQIFVSSDIYLPYSADKSPQKNGELSGRYTAIILAKSEHDMPTIKQEFLSILGKIPLENEKDVEKRKLGKSERSGSGFDPDTIIAHADTYVESFTSDIAGSDNDSGKSTFFTILGIFAVLFMLLPALNLININVSRIMERASEIGIRKAFGASAGTLTLQFIIENVIITLIGGALAIILSLIAIAYLNQNGVGPIKTLNLGINWTVVFIAMILSLLFGLMSGAYPAWRMSKLAIVDALKA
jgi:putative ABC transport system permease protein